MYEITIRFTPNCGSEAANDMAAREWLRDLACQMDGREVTLHSAEVAPVKRPMLAILPRPEQPQPELVKFENLAEPMRANRQVRTASGRFVNASEIPIGVTAYSAVFDSCFGKRTS